MPIFRLLAACCLSLALASAATAQGWPNRPIRIIAPTGPGAATDIMARLLADGITRKVGQPVIVENMPGASGIVAHQAAARAEPDGHTLLFTNTSGMAINLVSFKQLPYDPMRDFTPVAMVCSLGPQMLSVNADLPIRTVAELFQYAKANRGKLSIAFDTTAGAAAFGAKLLNRRGDLGLVEVPYRSAAQMTQDVASGVNQVMMSSIAAAEAIVQAGNVQPPRGDVRETLPRIAGSAIRQRDDAGCRHARMVRSGRAGGHARRRGRAAQSLRRRLP